jgi:hypothetical protein
MTFFLLQRMAGTRGLGARSETGLIRDRRGHNECFQFVVHEGTECYRRTRDGSPPPNHFGTVRSGRAAY